MPLDEILNDVLSEPEAPSGETPGGGEAGQPNAGNGEPPASAGAGPAGDGAEQGGEAPTLEQLMEQIRKDKPDLAPYAEELQKSFQRGYTSKFEEMAAQKRALEEQAQQYQAYAALEQLAREDPALARQIVLSRMGLNGEGVPVAESENDPYAQIELTETEALLAGQLQQVAAQQQQFQQFYEAQMRQQARAQVDAEFDQLGRTIGRDIPLAERETIAAFAKQQGILDVAQAFRAWDYDNALQRARQEGVNQGAATLQQKAGMAPPPAVAADRGGQVVEGPKNLDDVIAAALTAAGM